MHQYCIFSQFPPYHHRSVDVLCSIIYEHGCFIEIGRHDPVDVLRQDPNYKLFHLKLIQKIGLVFKKMLSMLKVFYDFFQFFNHIQSLKVIYERLLIVNQPIQFLSFHHQFLDLFEHFEPVLQILRRFAPKLIPGLLKQPTFVLLKYLIECQLYVGAQFNVPSPSIFSRLASIVRILVIFSGQRIHYFDIKQTLQFILYQLNIIQLLVYFVFEYIGQHSFGFVIIGLLPILVEFGRCRVLFVLSQCFIILLVFHLSLLSIQSLRDLRRGQSECSMQFVNGMRKWFFLKVAGIIIHCLFQKVSRCETLDFFYFVQAVFKSVNFSPRLFLPQTLHFCVLLFFIRWKSQFIDLSQLIVPTCTKSESFNVVRAFHDIHQSNANNQCEKCDYFFNCCLFLVPEHKQLYRTIEGKKGQEEANQKSYGQEPFYHILQIHINNTSYYSISTITIIIQITPKNIIVNYQKL